MSRAGQIQGVVVSESEVATDLGFSNVSEMRRWETETGQKLADTQEKLRSAISERDQFLWHGKRMRAVLERIRVSLAVGSPLHPDIELAIGVVLGKDVDWNHKLDGWFENQA